MSNEHDPAYVARCPTCQGIFMAVADTPKTQALTAKAVNQAIRAGGQIERVTVGYVREHGLTCTCSTPPRPRKKKG
jgi:stage V sporulation protein SpoVS